MNVSLLMPLTHDEVVVALNDMDPMKVSGSDRHASISSHKLCSILNNIISKVLVNHFQSVLHLCIDEAQSAFVSGRLITDNIILAHEILNRYHHKWIGIKVTFP